MEEAGLHHLRGDGRFSTAAHASHLTDRTVTRESLPAPVAPAPGSRAAHGSVVLVTGSAGAGKTTLMASWARVLDERGDGVGWVSLVRGDNDPAGLTASLLGAARAAITSVQRPSATRSQPPSPADRGEALRPVRDSGRRPRPPSGFLSRVTAEIVALDRDLWLMVDDVHLVRDPAALEAIEALLDQAPPNLHVVLGARADPAVRLSRLRLQQRLREVRDHDLRLSREETAAVVDLHGIPLDEEQVTRLHGLTEGWAAGIGLAVLSLTSGRDPESFLSAFARDDGAVAAYLVDEVLDSVADDRRQFMLDTCVPDDLPEALAVRLSGRDDAGRVLAELAAANSLLTHTLDADRTTYRYHSLLRSYLRARLRAASVQRSNLRHAEAAGWFAEQGRASDAVDHAVTSGEHDLVRAMLHRHAVGLLLDGESSRIERAVASTPEAVRGDPALLAVAAVASLQSGDLAVARRHLAAATVGASSEGDLAARPGPDGAGSTGVSPPTAGSPHPSFVPLPPERLISIASWTAAQFEDALDLAPAPLTSDLSPVPGGPARGQNGSAPNLADLDVLEQLQLAFALASTGRADESIPLFERSLRGARRTDRAFTVLSCLSGLTAASGAAGNLVATRRWAEEAIAYATPRGLTMALNLVLPYVCAAEAAYEHCDLDRAEHLVSAALAIFDPEQARAADTTPTRVGERDAVRTVARSLRAVATCIEFANAAPDPASQRDIVSRRLDELKRLPPAPFLDTLVGFEMLTLHRMALATAQLTIAEQVEQMATAIPALAGDALALRGLRALRLGHDREAREHVSRVVGGEFDCSLAASAVTALLVEVTVAQRNQQASVAHEALLLALAMTASQDGLRMMLDVSGEVLTALRSGRGRFGRHEPLVDRIIDTVGARDGDSARRRPHPAVGPGSAPLLSPKELSLLRDLPSLLTVSEIAVARSVSPNTVKTQLRSLFEKLEVGTRREAVAAARHEGLI